MASGIHKVDISWDRRPSGVVANVVYDNSRKLNAVNPPALLDLTEAFLGLAREDDLSVVVLSGAGGRALIGGADINHMVTMKVAEDGRKFLTQIHKFCQAIREDRYADLQDRDALLRVLMKFTHRKARDLIDRETAEKRGFGQAEGGSALAGLAGQTPPPDVGGPHQRVLVGCGRTRVRAVGRGDQHVATAKARDAPA